MADPKKQLKINTGAVNRIKKEVAMYIKESQDLKEKVDKMAADGKDEADVRKQTEVMQESLLMIPDAKSRLRKYVVTLNEHMVKAAEADLKDSEEYKNAETAEAEANAVLAE